MSPHTPCKQCRTLKPASEEFCEYCASRLPSKVKASDSESATALVKYEENSLTTLRSVAMLTFPIWGIGLIGWLAKAMGIPGAFNLVAVLAIFSPLPIVSSERLGIVAKLALVIGYYLLAVPLAIFTLLAVAGQA